MSTYRMPQLSSAFLALLEKELSTEYLQTPWTVAFSVKRMRSYVQLKKKERLESVGEVAGERAGGHEQEESEVKLSKQEARRLRKEQWKKEVS